MRIAMIPARLGSQRVPRKNLRYLGDRPLVAWVTETALACKQFDEVWVNSESEEIGAVAQQVGARWHRRPEALAADSATSEDFVREFLLTHPACSILAQITPTSPFLTVNDLVQAMELHGYAETVLTVREIRAEAFYNGVPVNFAADKPMVPSQQLTPLRVMCNGIFVWDADKFIERQDRYGTATYGYPGIVSHLPLTGASALDIDTEEDWAVAEATIAGLRPPRYWTPTLEAEASAEEVLREDGVSTPLRQMLAVPVDLTRAAGLIPDQTSGAVRILECGEQAVTLIQQLPGEGNRRHYHPDTDEFWLVLAGRYRFDIEGVGEIVVRDGEIIGVPRGRWHQITAIGTEPAVRLAVSRPRALHVYQD